MSQRLDSQESIILDPRGNNKLQNEPATGFQEELSNSKTPEYQRVPESQEELGLLRGFQSQLRGPCSKCGGGVYTHQLRGRDDNGMYFHAEPQHCAQAPTRRRDEEKTASAAVSEEAWMRQQDAEVQAAAAAAAAEAWIRQQDAEEEAAEELKLRLAKQMLHLQQQLALSRSPPTKHTPPTTSRSDRDVASRSPRLHRSTSGNDASSSSGSSVASRKSLMPKWASTAASRQSSGSEPSGGQAAGLPREKWYERMFGSLSPVRGRERERKSERDSTGTLTAPDTPVASLMPDKSNAKGQSKATSGSSVAFSKSGMHTWASEPGLIRSSPRSSTSRSPVRSSTSRSPVRSQKSPGTSILRKPLSKVETKVEFDI